MESKQLQSIKQHSDLLAQFIIRLSKFYEGFSPEIDQELQILRGHLSGQPNFTLATISINKINQTIHAAHHTVKKYTLDSTSQLEQAVKKLQGTLTEDPDLMKQSTQLLIALNQPVASLFALQTLSNSVVALFDEVSAHNQNTDDTSSGCNRKSIDALQKAILDELSQLIDTYAQRHPDDDQLVMLRNKLMAGVSEDELLQSCIVIIRMVVKDSLDEASLTGKVIQSLHNALGTINDNVNESIERSQSNFEARQQSHQEIRAKLDSIEDAFRQTESLNKLKEQAQAYIVSMSSTLSQRETAEQREQTALMSLLGEMQEKLVHLQKQTQHYCKKLAEQVLSNQTDPLTRLPNRRAYNERVSRECAVALERESQLSIAVVDIDHFKSINDRFGHAAGDKILQVVAKNLRSNLTKSDFIARWGGEEFVMLFPDTDGSSLEEKLDHIRVALTQLPLKFREEKVTISASFGGTGYRPGESADAMFERADSLLYRAKNSGRNCVIIDKDWN